MVLSQLIQLVTCFRTGTKYKIAGIVDLPEKLHQKILGYEIIAADDDRSPTRLLNTK